MSHRSKPLPPHPSKQACCRPSLPFPPPLPRSIGLSLGEVPLDGADPETATKLLFQKLVERDSTGAVHLLISVVGATKR